MKVEGSMDVTILFIEANQNYIMGGVYVLAIKDLVCCTRDIIMIVPVKNRTQLPLVIGFTLAHGHTRLVM